MVELLGGFRDGVGETDYRAPGTDAGGVPVVECGAVHGYG